MYIIIHADKYVKASLHLSSRWAFSRTIYIFDGFRDFLAAPSETLHASLVSIQPLSITLWWKGLENSWSELVQDSAEREGERERSDAENRGGGNANE